jgi:MoxR-like ATPase
MKINIKDAFKTKGDRIPFTEHKVSELKGIVDKDYMSEHNSFGRFNLSYEIGKALANFIEGRKIQGVASSENNTLIVQVGKDDVNYFLELDYNSANKEINIYMDGRKSVDLLELRPGGYELFFPIIAESYLQKKKFMDKIKILRENINQEALFCSTADDIFYFMKKTINGQKINEYTLTDFRSKKFNYDYHKTIYNSSSVAISIKGDPNEELYGLDDDQLKDCLIDPKFEEEKVKEKTDEKVSRKKTKRSKALFRANNLSKKEYSKEEAVMISMDPGYVSIDETKIKLINKAIENRDNILFVGPTSTGKSTIVHKISHDLQLPLYEVVAHKDAESDRYIGIRELKEGETKFIPGKITKPLMNGGIAFVDEFNFIQPGINMALHSVLDDRRQLEVLELSQEPIKAHDDFMFVAAMNEGDEYRGAFELNQATKRRFDLIIRFDYLDKEEEIKILMKKSGVENRRRAQKIVLVLNMCREAKKKDELLNPADTGTGIDWMKYSEIVGVKEAAEYTILETIPEDKEERKIVREQIRLQFG